MAAPARRQRRRTVRSVKADLLPPAVRLLVEAAQTKKAGDLVVLDLRVSTDVTDYFILCTAEADVHARAILDAVQDALTPLGRRPWHIEGEEGLSWVLVDFVDIVVHIFREDVRRFYALEEMWADAPRLPLPETPHAP